MRICSIICGAPCENPREKLQTGLVEGLVIAADRGLDHCLKAGITPKYAVGDFDSARMAVPKGVTQIVAPAEKNDTDTAIAVNIGIKQGCEEFRLFCALGGRFDHTFACLQTLFGLRKAGKYGALYGDGCKAQFAIDETLKFDIFRGYLSVFAFEGTPKVSISGAKYCLEDFVLRNTYPIGISNEILGSSAEISVEGGAALIIKQFVDE